MVVDEETFCFMMPETVFVNKRRLALRLMSAEKDLRSTAIPDVRGWCYEISSSHTFDRGNSVELFIQS